MCFGGGSKSSNTTPPPPEQPTTFDYAAANRGQTNANRAIGQLQAGKVISTTGGSFGSELGATAPSPTGAM